MGKAKKTVKIFLDDEEMKLLEEYCKAQDVSRTKLVKYAVLDFIRENKEVCANEYRGIRWRSIRGLARTLNRSESSVRIWLLNNKDKAVTDYIDYVISKEPWRVEGVKR